MACECLQKRHMGLHKIGTWMLVKKTYETTQNWHINACEKDIWDYTKLAHECLWKTHMGLHKYGTWMLVKKAYGTTQNLHMNAHEKDIWDYTKLAHEQLLLIIPRKFWKQCLTFCHSKFLLPNKKRNMIIGSKEIEERRIFFCTYNYFNQRMPNHSYNFFIFYHFGVWVDGVPYQSRDHLNTW